MAEVNVSSTSAIVDLIVSTISSLTMNIVADDIAVITNGTNSTVATTNAIASTPIWAGFLGCFVATIFFGSNLVPVKQFSAGDGVFFQFVFCVPVYIIGLIVDLILNNQRFYPLVLVGGILSNSSLSLFFSIRFT